MDEALDLLSDSLGQREPDPDENKPVVDKVKVTKSILKFCWLKTVEKFTLFLKDFLRIQNIEMLLIYSYGYMAYYFQMQEEGYKGKKTH